MTDGHVHTMSAPEPLGTYSQAVCGGDLLFCATQLPLEPDTGQLADDSAHRQANQCLDNLEAVCHAAGTHITAAVRITVYIVDRGSTPDVDRAFKERFGRKPPARVTVHVVSLGKNALVSMDAIVALR